jgi:hypothetical protein
MSMIKMIGQEPSDIITALCAIYGIWNYTICEDGLGLYLNVSGDVYLSYLGLTSIPMRFGMVSGNFYCNFNDLTSLAGSPIGVHGSFNCNGNGLTSSEGCPKKVGGIIICDKHFNKESYYHLFDLGYEDASISCGIDLVGLRRQWVINNIINGE